METCEEPIFPGFEDESLSYPPASPASRLPWPGSAEARAMTVGSGRQLSMLCEQSSPLGYCSKILLESSLWTSSEEFSYVWNRLDTKFGLSAFQLTPLALNIEDSGCSLFATPQAHDCHEGNAARVGRFGTRHGGRNLVDEVKLWRTPQASDVTGGGQDGEKTLRAGHAMQLSDQVKTPKLWPTPRNDHSGLESHGVTYLGGSLNPEFVCQLMGFPADWTQLKMPHPRTPDPIKYCLTCSKELHRQVFNGRLEDMGRFKIRKYCDAKCMGIARRIANPKRRTILKQIRHLRKEVCEHCGTTQKLSLHHIDLDWSNNDPANIQTLCMRCHLLLHHRFAKGKRLETVANSYEHSETRLSPSKPTRSSKRSRRSKEGVQVELVME
jgi:hypothetical protein